MMIRRGQAAGLWAWERARGQVRRFSDTRYARAARPEKLEEEGQYGWWPALDGEAYRQRLKTFSIVSSVAAAGYFMLNYERTDGREHAFSGIQREYRRRVDAFFGL